MCYVHIVDSQHKLFRQNDFTLTQERQLDYTLNVTEISINHVSELGSVKVLLYNYIVHKQVPVYTTSSKAHHM